MKQQLLTTALGLTNPKAAPCVLAREPPSLKAVHHSQLSNNFTLIKNSIMEAINNGQTILSILMGAFIILLFWFNRGKAKSTSGGCFSGVFGAFGFFLAMFLGLYLLYPIVEQLHAGQNQEQTEESQTPPTTEKVIHDPPELLPPKPIEEEWGEEYQPDSNRRFNVGPLPFDTFPPAGPPLYDEISIEAEVFDELEPRYFYAQLSAAPTEARILKAKEQSETRFEQTLYVGYDKNDLEYPYKLLMGPFVDKASARKASKGQRAWIRDIRLSKDLWILTYP